MKPLTIALLFIALILFIIAFTTYVYYEPLVAETKYLDIYDGFNRKTNSYEDSVKFLNEVEKVSSKNIELDVPLSDNLATTNFY